MPSKTVQERPILWLLQRGFVLARTFCDFILSTKKEPNPDSDSRNGDPGGARTLDTKLKRLVL